MNAVNYIKSTWSSCMGRSQINIVNFNKRDIFSTMSCNHFHISDALFPIINVFQMYLLVFGAHANSEIISQRHGGHIH